MLAATPWPAEDGGPQRRQRAPVPGPRATSARLAATRQAPVSVMAVWAPDDRLLLLRNTIGADAVSWVEELDPESLEPRRRSPDLPLGPFWPGGLAALSDGAAVVVQGCWAHRLGADLSVEQARRLPADAPYNSFVVLGDGSIATKDLRRPDEGPSTLSILDPATLADRAEPWPLPEGSVARISADGDEIFVVGVTGLHRVEWSDGALAASAPTPYRVHDGQSFGWDPVVEAGAVWWMDNGDHTFASAFTMLGQGVAEGPVRLWRLPLAGGPVRSVEVCGRPGGAVSNPPLVDVERGIALAYDSANGVLAALDTADLTPRWERPLATAEHLVLYPDTGEVLVNDFDRQAGDALAVVQIEDGTVAASVRVESPAQSVVFCTPGSQRDAYYVSLTTVARVVFA